MSSFEFLQSLTSASGRRYSFYRELTGNRLYMKTSGGLLQIEAIRGEKEVRALAVRPVGFCCVRSEYLDDDAQCNACKATYNKTITEVNPFIRLTYFSNEGSAWHDQDENISAVSKLCFRLDSLTAILCAREIVDWLQTYTKLEILVRT